MSRARDCDAVVIARSEATKIQESVHPAPGLLRFARNDALQLETMSNKNNTPTKTRRKEDASLLSGRGRYADDLPVPVGTLYAHVIRSPHAHADIVRIDAGRALAHDGVWAVLTGEDIHKLSNPFLAPVKTPVQQWSLAVERARYVGEPVALVVAESRYVAEDAAELVEIEYAALPAVIDPVAACQKSAPLLHPQAGTNEVSVREFRYGDTDAAFARADRRIAPTRGDHDAGRQAQFLRHRRA